MARGESLGQAIADESRSALDAYVREGARQMLQAALECEVEAFLAEHADRADEHGRKQVVRNGYLPGRTIMTGAGPLEIEQPRVRDKSRHADERVVFTSTILPPYLRKSRSIEELIPWLYLKGVSTGDYPEALQALLGKDAKGFSPNVIVRLKEKWGQEYEEWSRRNLSGEEYVYVWADGIHVNVRLEDEGNQKQCLLVLMGATAEGRKELIAVIDGVRESKQSWQELLLDLNLGRSPGGLPDDQGAAVLGSQDGQRPQQDAEGPSGKGEERPSPDLARRDQGDGDQGLRPLPGEVRCEVRGGVQLPLQESRRASGLLRLPGGTLGSRADHQPHRKHLLHDPPAASTHEGQRLEEG